MTGSPPTTADRIFLRALAAWAGPDADRLLGRLEPGWRDRLADARGEIAPASGDPEAARFALRCEHEATARPFADRVHPSWWVRALKEESPAVRRAVAAHAPGPIQRAVREGLGLAVDDLASDRPPHPEALQWALSLWSERLIGDLPARDDDPPAVVALTALDRRDLQRFLAAVGLAKRAYDPASAEAAGLRPLKAKERERLAHFRDRWGPPDDRLARVARQDLSAGRAPHWPGLVAIGRLLAPADPYRVRWALQHLPYPVAKFLRSRMSLNHPLVTPRALLDWEGRAFGMARDRLRDEGRLHRLPGGPS